MSSLFLFGAGASFGSGACVPHAPPLGSELFPALQKAGGAASIVSSDLAQLFVSDFEAGMDRFWLEHHTHTTELLRNMARYLAQFEPSEGNLYMELIRILGGTRKKALMVSTNYDLLIEHAILKSGLMGTYGGFPAPTGYMPVLKIHGSCNFLPDLRNGQISGIDFDLSNSPGCAILEANVRMADSVEEIINFCDTQDSIAPALAMYSPSKQLLFCRDFVQGQQRAFVSALHDVSRIYVLGLRVHAVDVHIWGALAMAQTPLYYVGREPTEFVAWAKTNGRRDSCVLAETFRDALPRIAAHLRH